jgi:hypothetical protein
VGRDGDGYGSIWDGGEAKYFFNEGWTGQITLNALRKLVFTRSAFRRKFCAERPDQFTYSSPPGKSVDDSDARCDSQTNSQHVVPANAGTQPLASVISGGFPAALLRA